MAILEKKVILFTDDQDLANVVTSGVVNCSAGVYSYDAFLPDIGFSGRLVLLDIDTSMVDPRGFVTEVIKHLNSENRLIVVGTDCERKNISDYAKLGVDRFVVKPLNRKRFKNLILPYIESELSAFSDNSPETLM
ncbi:MAG: hypothetical protein JXA66_00410 [Oligoflexia bacterium]|nr:hypothetical protein [Oligoflexia bacterium]